MTCTSPHSGQATVTVVVGLSKSLSATIITLTPHLQRQVDIVVITVAQILRRGHSTYKRFHTEVIYEGWPVLRAAFDQRVRKIVYGTATTGSTCSPQLDSPLAPSSSWSRSPCHQVGIKTHGCMTAR